MAGRPPAVSDYEVIHAVQRAWQESGDPAVTTSEVAEHVPIKREGLGRRLNDLASLGLVNRKSVGASYIWWVPEEIQPVVQTTAQRSAASNEHGDVDRDTSHSLETRLQTLFDIGHERFDLELGALAQVDPDDDWFQVEYASDTYEGFEPGTEFPLSETYCTTATAAGGPASVTNPDEEGFSTRTVCADIGFQTYLGTVVDVEGHTDRTFFFVSATPRDEPFTDADFAFQNLLGQRVGHELREAT